MKRLVLLLTLSPTGPLGPIGPDEPCRDAKHNETLTVTTGCDEE